jgi:hypothetical protein
VIDRATGREAGQSHGLAAAGVEDAASRRKPLPGLPKQVSFDGSAELTTHPFYDVKAPRTIRLDPGSAATMGRVKLVAVVLVVIGVVAAIAQPALLAVLAIFANKQLRTGIRRSATRWLDRVEAEAN